MLKDGNFPDNMCGELFFTTVYLSNRLPHAALGESYPFSKMHKEVDMTSLRVIGARAFVHTETYKAFEGKLCGFSPNSRAYRIYNAEKGTVVESQNVTFLQCPSYTQPTGTGHIDYFDDEDATCVRDDVDHKCFLDKDTAVDSPETLATKVVETEHLHSRSSGKWANGRRRTGRAQPRQEIDVQLAFLQSKITSDVSSRWPRGKRLRISRQAYPWCKSYDAACMV